MSTENAATFDCPDCDVSAPSTSVPYDSLGYVLCPVCGYAAAPNAERPPSAGRSPRTGD